MFKKIIVMLLTVLMMVSLASCGVKQSVDDKIAEKVTEGVINKATGGEANLDIDKGQLTMEGEDGEKITIGSNKWPADFAATQIPEFKKGNIVSSISSKEGGLIIVEEVDLHDFEQYVEELKTRGFVNDATAYTSELGHSYSAGLNDTTRAYVQYSADSKTLSINVEIGEN